MTAPDEPTLRRFLLGQLSAAEAAPVETFLETQPDTARALDRLTADDTLTAALRGRTGDLAVPPEAEELARRLESLDADQTRTAGGDSSSEAPGDHTDLDMTSVLAPPRGPGELGWLGEFRVLRVLGRGGMGIVFEAEDARLGRRVAVKAMLPKLAADPNAKARFVREARAAAAVEHDHVVPIHRIDESGPVPFLVMPFLKGESLDDRLKRDGTLPIPEVVRIGREVAEGLAAAHDRGLVHRDVKPANIWLEGGRGRVKLLDFGLARPVTAAEAGADITRSGAVVGTPAYMSPEQGRGRPVDLRTDLFSLGGVLYRACTGRTPFTGADSASILMSLAADTPADVRSLNPAAPAWLAVLIHQLLEKDPANRPASAHEVARFLAAPVPTAATDETELLPPAPVSHRRSRRSMALAGVVLIVGLGLLFAPTIVRIATNRGELVIEVDDPRIEVVVKGSDAEVHDRSKDRRYVLKAGDGQVEFLDPDGGAGGLTKTFRITRGGKEVVRATMAEIAAARPPADPLPDSAADESVPHDRFPGKQVVYNTFDDPTKTKLHLGTYEGAKSEVTRGRYSVTAAANTTPAAAAGPPLADLGFAARVRSAGGLRIEFRRRGDELASSEMTLAIHPDGTWKLGSGGKTSRVNPDGTREMTAAEQHLARSDFADPKLSAGQWVSVAVRSVGDDYTVWLNGDRAAEGTVSTDRGRPLALNAILVTGGSPPTPADPAARPPGRLEIDYLAVWDLSATGQAAPAPWAGDGPPPRSLFPGEVVAYETFDDPKASPIPVVEVAGLRTAVRAGAFAAEQTGRGYSAIGAVGPAVGDLALVTRIKATDQSWFVTFRSRADDTRQTWLGFRVNPDGTWRLVRNHSVRAANGEWQTVEPTPLKAAEASVPELAAGRWVALTVRSVGPDVVVSANGKELVAVREPDEPGRLLPPAPGAVGFGTLRDHDRPGTLEVDYLVVWDLSKAAAAAAGDGPPPRSLFPGEVVAYETFDRPTDQWPPPKPPRGMTATVADGLLRTDLTIEWSHWFGPPTADVGVTTRFKATSGTAYVSFGLRRTPTSAVWLTLLIKPSGEWTLMRRTATPKPPYGKRDEKLVTGSGAPVEDYAAGKWVGVTARAETNRYELRVNGRLLSGGPIDLPAAEPLVDLGALEVGLSPEPKTPARLEIDYAAAWRLPVGPLWPGDKSPPRDLFPGEVTAHETFDAGTGPLFTGAEDGVRYAVEDGAYHVDGPVPKRGEFRINRLGRPAADGAFAVRVRGAGCLPYVSFRDRRSADRWTFLSLVLVEDRWQLRWTELGLADGTWKPRRNGMVDEAKAADPLLASGRWATLAARAVGDEYEVWVNGQSVSRGPLTAVPDVRGGQPVFGVSVGAFDKNRAAARAWYEIDYATVWKLTTDPLTTFTNPVGMKFAIVPRGKAWLGGGSGQPGDQEVEFKDDFYVGAYPVTQEEWEKVMGSNPAHFSRHGPRKDLVKDIPDAELKRFPVEGVSFADVEAFLVKLNEKDKQAGWVYRLPTEAEWEYACRGGPIDKAQSAFHYYVGEPANELPRDLANYAYKGSSNRTCKVGLHPPNRLGLHDMHANVLEWCSDPGRNAQREETRIARGGSWNDPPGAAARRIPFLPTVRYASLGVRVVRAPESGKK